MCRCRQKMVMFHAGMDDMQQLLTEAEREKAKWQPVGDVLLEALQTEIDKVKVGRAMLLDTFSVSSVLLSFFQSLCISFCHCLLVSLTFVIFISVFCLFSFSLLLCYFLSVFLVFPSLVLMLFFCLLALFLSDTGRGPLQGIFKVQ